MSEPAQPQAHNRGDKQQLRCRVIVISDSRTLATDEAGKQLTALAQAAGHRVDGRVVVPDTVEAIADAVTAQRGLCDALLLTGGTGMAPRDVTPEAVAPLLDRQLPGFGEAFRRLSYDEIGAHGLLSRALAGVSQGCVIFALPGSTKACVSAMQQLVLPLLPHLAGLARPAPVKG